MRTTLIALAAATGLFTTQASAQTATVNFGSLTPVPSTNDYQADLAALGLSVYANGGSSITLNGPVRITFDFLASESGFIDTFTSGGVTFTQDPDANAFGAPVNFGSAVFGAGAFLAQFTSDFGALANVGGDGFAIFLPASAVDGFTTSVLYFGYDNQITDPDDNHDDLIIRATLTAVPEASTWAMMIVGFGLVGVGLRSRRGIKSIAA